MILNKYSKYLFFVYLFFISVTVSQDSKRVKEKSNEVNINDKDNMRVANELYKSAFELLQARKGDPKYAFDPATNNEEIDSSESGILSLSVKLIQNAISSSFKKEENVQNEKEEEESEVEETEIQEPVLAKVVKKLTKAAELNHPDSIYMLGAMNLFSSYSHPRNIVKAVEYFKKLSDLNGSHKAQHLLGIIYSTGIGGIEKDPGLGMLYHTFAARAGNPGSNLVLGYRHLNGISTTKSCNAALEYYKIAAEKAVEKYLSGPPGGLAFPPKPNKISEFDGGVFGDSTEKKSRGRQAQLQEYNELIEYHVYLSSSGDIASTYALAGIYYYGNKIIDKNFAQARKYLNVLMDKIPTLGPIESWEDEQKKILGSAYALLGLMFLRGEAVAKSEDTAFKYFKQGKTLKNPMATYWYGKMLMDKKGDEKSIEEGLASLTFAANSLENPEANVQLGLIQLDRGKKAEAYQYFNAAAKEKSFLGSYYLANFYSEKSSVQYSCTHAVSLYKAVAERGVWDFDHMTLGYRNYKRGEIETAIIHYIIAAESGIEMAQENVAWLIDQARYKLANINMKYKSVSHKEDKETSSLYQPNYELALIYWTRSANQDNPESRVKQGDYYFYGLGTKKPDYEKAAVCYRQAAEKHFYSLAMWNIGWMYENGIGLPKDYHLAKRWYDQSLERNPNAALPVNLSLFKLRIKHGFEIVKKLFKGEKGFSFAELLLFRNRYSTTNQHQSEKKKETKNDKLNNKENELKDKPKEWHLADEFEDDEYHFDTDGDSDSDNYIILILCLFVGWLVYVRQFGMGNNNNNNNNQNQNPPPEAQPEDQPNDLTPANSNNDLPRQINPDPATGQN